MLMSRSGFRKEFFMREYISYRREFHKYAEISWTELRTTARVVEILREIGVPEILMGEDVVDTSILTYPLDLSEETRRKNTERALSQGADAEILKSLNGYPGAIGIIDTKRPGKTVAFRFDMDALPYDEAAVEGFRPFDEGYISINPGAVHACGHDSHTAIGLGLAREIMKHPDEYTGKIKLIFQPAEETNKGALSIVSKGHLSDCDEVMAVHLAISAENRPLPSHTLCCGVYDFMSCHQLDVTFHGRAAHPCGAAQEGRNALLAACAASLSIHTIASHEKGLSRANVGAIYGGDCTNTICPECTIKLEFRGTEPEISDYMEERVHQCLEGAANMYGVTYSILDYGVTPVAHSDNALMDRVKEAASKIPWFEKIYYEGNMGGSDDAAAMISEVQSHGGLGTYIGIGCDITEPLHNPRFDFDEDCMEPAIQLLGELLRD